MATDLFGQPIRLRYFECRLFGDGCANATTLTVRFGISRQQASADINEYQRIAGAALRYCASAKTYILDRRHKPKLVSEKNMQPYTTCVELLQILTDEKRPKNRH